MRGSARVASLCCPLVPDLGRVIPGSVCCQEGALGRWWLGSPEMMNFGRAFTALWTQKFVITTLHACVLCCFSCALLFVTLWTVARQASLSLGFSRPCPSPRGLPDSGIKPASLTSPALAGWFFTTSVTWEAPVTTLLIHKNSRYVFCCLASGSAGGQDRGAWSMALHPRLEMEFGNMSTEAGCENCHLYNCKAVWNIKAGWQMASDFTFTRPCLPLLFLHSWWQLWG